MMAPMGIGEQTWLRNKKESGTEQVEFYLPDKVPDPTLYQPNPSTPSMLVYIHLSSCAI